MDVDEADVERPTVEGSSLENFHDWPDRVVRAEVMIQAKLVQALAPIAFEESHPSAACPCHLCAAAVNQTSAGRR
jgi:hypothetical protein